jgi:uncharacterized membrane protein YccF (DUF307 family)
MKDREWRRGKEATEDPWLASQLMIQAEHSPRTLGSLCPTHSYSYFILVGYWLLLSHLFSLLTQKHFYMGLLEIKM